MCRKILSIVATVAALVMFAGCSEQQENSPVANSLETTSAPVFTTTVSETEEAVTTEAPPPPYAKTTSEYKEELVANILTAFAVGDEDVFNLFPSYSYKEVYNDFCKYLNEDLQIDYKSYTLPLDSLEVYVNVINGLSYCYVFDFNLSKEDALFVIHLNEFDYTTETYSVNHISAISANSSFVLNYPEKRVDITPYLTANGGEE